MSLRFGILGLIADEALHGYEVKQRFEDMLGGTWDVNIGSVYQMLQRLERDGLVEAVGERGDRGRQAYRATRAGRTVVAEWLGGPDKQPELLRDEVYVKVLLLARAKDPDRERIRQVLDTQRRAYLQRLRDLADQERAARNGGGAAGASLALLFQAGRLHTEASLKWLDACAEELAGL